ncbi:MAG: HAD-IA family hydrolase [Blautia sp.]|nr:HAD-IA family hydrolase [Blautia sp.]
MEKMKRILAVIGIAAVLAAACLPMIFAGGTGEGSAGRFIGAAAAAVFIPILVYICMMAVRVFGPGKNRTGQVKNVIFDIGNVLMKFGWEDYLDGYGFPEEKRERLADAIFRNSLWNERDRGSMTEEEYRKAFVAAAPEYEQDVIEIIERSPECIHLFPYSATWLQYLKERGFNTFILSNYSAYMLEHTRKDMAFLKFADGAVFSCEEKMIKPEEDIYRTLLSRYGLKPEECVFIDDRKDNVDTALRLGMKGIVFKGFKEAAAKLEELGVK